MGHCGQYTILGNIGEGAHGIVFKAKHIESWEVALKKVPLRKLEDGIPNTALRHKIIYYREIKALQEIEDNQNVVKLIDVFPYGTGFVLVFEYMLSDLSEVLRNSTRPLTEAQMKSYLLMLLKGVVFCHENYYAQVLLPLTLWKNNIALDSPFYETDNFAKLMWDLKPANLLINSTEHLKIADFGLARVWYMAPELLYGARLYDEGVDLSAVGCIFGELLNNSPLFPGESDIAQLYCVLRVRGTPRPGQKIERIRSELDTAATTDSGSSLDAPCAGSVQLASFRILSQEYALLHPYFFTESLPAHHSELPIPARNGRKASGRGPLRRAFDIDVPLEKSLVNPALLVHNVVGMPNFQP
ncbi:Cyclin-dependent kinase 20 [Acropora cervicornis]|uniref:Cyclin-dependent kinase 20 n=1 Tax=Acropora cervicornis TaxID=6130 RepID=A0AAD9PQ66_ACRCE|nr:Cyclin-dependent kinase 20 [Acropora cervicornis]